MEAKVRFRMRLYRDTSIAVGPGKIDLLEAVAAHGSISAGARAMSMSYRRAWLLIDEINRCLTEPVLETATGGAHGGGAVLTPTGQRLIALYREAEVKALQAAHEEVAALLAMVAPPLDEQA